LYRQVKREYRRRRRRRRRGKSAKDQITEQKAQCPTPIVFTKIRRRGRHIRKKYRDGNTR